MNKLLWLPFMILTVYAMAQNPENKDNKTNDWHIVEYEMSDFDSIKKSGQKLDFLLGGMVNGFAGNINDYLNAGNGLRMDLLYQGKKGFGIGLNLSGYGNKIDKPFPIKGNRTPLQKPNTLMAGLNLAKTVYTHKRSEILLQFEFNFIQQNFLQSYENDNVDFSISGFSPAFVVNYTVQLGKDRFSNGWGGIGMDGGMVPSVFSHHINFHLAMRPLFMEKLEARGMMLEVGMAYKLRNNFIRAYKLKPNRQ
jgi:hypothetical protein